MTVPCIIITGFMATGKTTVAQALARRLGCAMVDLDYIITEREKRTISELFTQEGEARFREAEAKALRAALETGTPRVIALGGGAWMLERNRALIRKHNCLTVWLDAPFDLCWQRIESAENERPLAHDRETARKLYEERLMLYHLAELHIRVSEEKSADEMVDEIVAALPAPPE